MVSCLWLSDLMAYRGPVTKCLLERGSPRDSLRFEDGLCLNFPANFVMNLGE
jgi:hypothetical protein